MAKLNNEAYERAIQERDELKERITKLAAYLASFKVLEHQIGTIRLMVEQLFAMQTYLAILETRIKYWESEIDGQGMENSGVVDKVKLVQKNLQKYYDYRGKI